MLKVTWFACKVATVHPHEPVQYTLHANHVTCNTTLVDDLIHIEALGKTVSIRDCLDQGGLCTDLQGIVWITLTDVTGPRLKVNSAGLWLQARAVYEWKNLAKHWACVHLFSLSP